MSEPISDIFPLTYAQAGLLLGTLAEPQPGLYVVQMHYSMTGALDPARLESAWQQLTARHDALRTAVTWEQTAQPLNVVMGTAEMPVVWLDLRDLDDEATASALDDLLIEDRERGFDLSRAPLSRVTVVRKTDSEWHMVWTHHHLILDGWSTARLSQELWQHYAGQRLTEPTLTFGRFAADLAIEAQRHRAEDDSHWRHRVAGGDQRIAIDRPRSPEAAIWADRAVEVPDDRGAAWVRGAQHHGVTLSTLYHASWALVLREAGLGDDLVLGTVADTRGTRATGVIGLCIASLPLRVSFSRATVGEWLSSLAVERAAAQDHARINLAEHRTWSDDGASAPFRYLLAVETYPDEALTGPVVLDDLTVQYQGVHESTEYALTAGVPAGDWRLKLTFDTRRIATADAEELLTRWSACLDLLAGSGRDLPLPDLLASAPLTDGRPGLHDRIAQLALRHPDRPAFRDAAGSLTFADLDVASRQLARRLRRDGVDHGDRVGILVDDSSAVAVAMLGTLRCGGVVVALDPRHPAPYRRAVLAAAKVSSIVTSSRDTRPEWGGVIPVAVSDLAGDANVPGSAVPDPSGGAAGGFHVYRAGSSRRPSGHSYSLDAVLEHTSVVAGALSVTEDDTWVVTRPIGDGAPWEMWVAPLQGGCTVIAHAGRLAPDELARLAPRDAGSVVCVTASDAAQVASLVHSEARVVTSSRDGDAASVWSAAGERLVQLAPDVGIPEGGTSAHPDDQLADDILDLVRGVAGDARSDVRRDADGSLVALLPDGLPRSCLRDTSRALRSALPEDRVPRIVTAGRAAVAGSDEHEVQQRVSALWAEVLGLSQVPPDTPFFDLGGHSLLLFAVLRELRNQGWRWLGVTDLLAHPTVRSLSRRLTRQDSDGRTPQAPGSPRRSASAGRRERGRA